LGKGDEVLRIHSYETMSATDGPGLRTVFFVQGCNFRCLYCHNPDTQRCAGGIAMTDKELIEILKRNLVYYGGSGKVDSGGVTFSGGEVLLQAKPLLPLMRRIQRELKISVVIDTNGSILSEEAKAVLEEADLVIFDLKQIDEKKHLVLTGQSQENVREAIKLRESFRKPFWLRLVLVPDLTDDEGDLRAWGEWARQFFYLQKVEVLPYHTLGVYKYKMMGRDYPLDKLRTANKEDVARAEKLIAWKKKTV
jgi:pyruvate formate lyase activating enzyme